ncbi:hypothetical protein SAMN04488515_0755 [Cognatiyoonia koreensis]|uniref:Uncharacterized protein n=1 Tax=Cognatiyoonia koreensis TaxID=364200 RepID=A0A1I0NRR5_9RHOB|nr:hypothetical protein [Cognatiyoonia koreensis]SEW03596.1 hypothetical protein SAMN04488515_0755 [Cognatiyoonia koreensis]
MRFIAMLTLMAGPVAAEDWSPLITDDAIYGALAGRTLIYDAYTRQQFGADGSTQYITERFSEGRWAARDGQYCSQWPPSDGWTCYYIELNESAVKFISPDRTESVGTYRK